MALNSAQIAKIAGVSRSTVSKVIHDYQDIPYETKQKVLKVINEYGYKSSASKHSGCYTHKDSNKVIGLYFYILSSYHNINYRRARYGFGSAYDMEILHTLTLEAQKRGYSIIFNIIADSDGKENIIHRVRSAFESNQICAAVFVDLDDDADFIEEIASPEHHVLVIDKQVSTANGARCLFANDYDSARRACEVLYNNGYCNILHISGEQTKLSARERCRGYIDFIHNKQNTAPSKVIYGMYSMEDGYKAAEQFIDEKLYTTYNGILVACDTIGVGFLRCLHERRADLIDNIGIIGFDNEAVGMFTAPPISSMMLNFSTLARFILDFEENYDDFKGGISLKIDHDFIERESSMPQEKREVLRKERLLLNQSQKN